MILFYLIITLMAKYVFFKKFYAHRNAFIGLQGK